MDESQSNEAEVDLRQPRLQRTLRLGWACLWTAVLVIDSISQRDIPWPALPIVVLLFLIWRVGNSRVVSTGSTLTSIGPLRTRSWNRDEIKRFAMTVPWWSGMSRMVELSTRDGRVATLPATLEPFWQGERVERAVTQLTRWHFEPASADDLPSQAKDR